MLHPHVPKTEEPQPHRLPAAATAAAAIGSPPPWSWDVYSGLLQDDSSVSLLADNIADALIEQAGGNWGGCSWKRRGENVGNHETTKGQAAAGQDPWH